MIQTLARVMAGIAFVLVAAELSLSYVLAGPLPTDFDPRYGKVGRPGASLVQSEEGYFNGHLNSWGHVDHEPVPGDRRPRILVLGDSQTAAREVPLEASFANRLEAMIGANVENAGVAGWSPVNHAAYLTDFATVFQPDRVVLQLGGGDFDDLQETHRIHLVRKADGFAIELPAKQVDVSAARALARKAMRSSALATHVVRRAGLLATEQTQRLRAHFLGARPAEPPCGAPPEPWVVDAFRFLLTDMRNRAPDLTVLYLPRLEFLGGCADQCRDRAQVIRSVVDQLGVRLVDPTAALCADFEATGQPGSGFANSLIGEGHFNQRGHEVIAKSLAGALAGIDR